MGGSSLPLKLKVGKKGYIILPKAVREALGINEGDEVIVEVKDGIVLKPAKRRIDEEMLKESFRRHLEKLKGIKSRKEPKPGEVSVLYLEEEFER